MKKFRLHLLWPCVLLALSSETFAASVIELVAEKAGQDLGVQMPESGYFNVLLPADSPSEGMAIREFWIDQQSGQFIANLVTKDGILRRISGLALLTLPVPVAKRRLLPDEIIQEEDIEIEELPWQRVHAFAILKPEELVGKQVKRMIAQGRPVQLQSVIPPILVSRGEHVKIELNQGALRLVTLGKALSDAYLGQEVRVVNLSSNKTITATAKGDGLVEVYQ